MYEMMCVLGDQEERAGEQHVKRSGLRTDICRVVDLAFDGPGGEELAFFFLPGFSAFPEEASLASLSAGAAGRKYESPTLI